ncbi:Positive regulator of CheA protein activity [Minicystis rosea]|nr:Positive regulator of CheA protein activity [Minicystis rosea]
MSDAREPTWSAEDHAILLARTRALSAAKNEGDAAGLLEVITLRIGGEAYLIPAAAVRAVADLVKLAPLPHAPPEVAGLTVRNGEILPVFHLRAVLGLALSALPEQSPMVLLGEGADAVALIADAVEGVRLIDPTALREAPPTLSAAARALVRGVGADGIPLLDPGALLASPRLFVDIPPPSRIAVSATTEPRIT